MPIEPMYQLLAGRVYIYTQSALQNDVIDIGKRDITCVTTFLHVESLQVCCKLDNACTHVYVRNRKAHIDLACRLFDTQRRLRSGARPVRCVYALQKCMYIGEKTACMQAISSAFTEHWHCAGEGNNTVSGSNS